MKFVEEVRAVVTEASNSILPTLESPIGESLSQEALSEASDSKTSTGAVSRKKN